MRKIKAGFVSFGEVNTPREIIERLANEAIEMLPQSEFELFVTAPVSDDPQGAEAKRALSELLKHDFDVLIVCIAGWIPSYTVLNVIDRFRHCPMVLWGLVGWQEGRRIITTASQAGSTALRQPLAEMGFNFKYVTQALDGPPPISDILDFARAARAKSLLRGARIGQMGYRDMKLYATMFDGLSLRGQIGPEMEFFEMLEIERKMKECDSKTISVLREQMEKEWQFTKPAQPSTFENAIRLAWALQQKIRECGYQGLSFKDVDGVKQFFKFAPAGAMTLLHTMEPEICTIPENDSLGAVTQLMVRYLTGQVGAYLEFYDFFTDGALMGVPDYVPPQIVEGSVRVTPAAFGEFGEGLLNVSQLKTGAITIARLTYLDGYYYLHLATGTALPPPAWEEAGWQPPAPQLPSLRVKLDAPMAEFQAKVMGQHYILLYGDWSSALADLAQVLDIDVIADV